MGHISSNFSGFPLTHYDGAVNASAIETNRDFYVAIAFLRTMHDGEQRNLETYLSALLGVARKFRNEAYFSLEDFAEMLREALEAPAVDAGIVATKVNGEHDTNGSTDDPYECWEQTILQQIADLREMREAGELGASHEVAQSIHGEIWRNTSVPEYLECAAAGTFGGWDLGGETGVRKVDWSTAQQFLNAGQKFD
jgi:hypothetical protein